VDQSPNEFVLEIEELVEHVFADLDLLRSKQQEGPARRRLLESIFRRVHSIKGSAASSNLARTSELAHRIENLLDSVRSGRVRVSDDLLDAIEFATDLLSSSLAPNAQIEFGEAFERLNNAEIANKSRGEAEKVLQALPSEIWQSLSEQQRNHLVEILEEGWELFVVGASFAVADFDQQFHRLRESLEVFGEVVATYPSVDPANVARINFRLLCVSRSDLGARRGALGKFDNLTITRPIEDARKAAKESQRTRVAALQPARIAVRLDLNQLDSLISSSHELFRKTSNALKSAKTKSNDLDELQTTDEEIATAFLTVQEQIINLRMVSIGRILKRAERAGRAAARATGKDIVFETVGLDLRLDKLLAEAIASPLMHLVRNAVDHGIETPSERSLAGKPAHGSIRLEAISEASQTTIRVVDDGRGINPEVVSRRAIEAGLIPAGATLDLRQSLRMIFRAGFSTVQSSSSTSGRGVGLDVVESSVEEVGGDVRVSTRPGVGATFAINLPMTFGLMHSMVVVSNGFSYCLDAGSVVSANIIQSPQIEQTPDGAKLIQDGEVLPITELRKLLEQPQLEMEQMQQVVVCEVVGKEKQSSKKIALVVDKIRGTESVLTRNLGSHAGRWYGIAGATELRDGSVALVLDLPRLLSGIQ
jgi:two-component system chemotaxis sensor kinase CheA